MCFPSRASVQATPPAPPPPTPPPPEPPKPLPEPKQLEDDKTKPNVLYGKKKSSDIKAKKGTDALRIPLNTPNTGGQSGGLNV